MAKTKHRQHDALVLYPHHRKPYRVHHLASLVITILIVFAVTLELGIVIGHNQRKTPPPKVPAAAAKTTSNPIVVRSAYGYSFTADSNVFSVTATELSSSGQLVPASQDELKTDQKLISSTVKTKPGTVSGRLAAAQLSIKFSPDSGATVESAAKLFPITAGREVTAKTLSRDADKLNGVPVQKTVYEFTGKHSGGKSYAIQWTGVNKGRAFSVELQGLVGRSSVPDEFAAVLDSLTISADQAVLGSRTNATVFSSPTARAEGVLDAKYLSDALSPAVVQIFHTLCGVLVVNDQALGDSACVTFSGSGFLATEAGYIATNGHVVVYTAKDALADIVTSNNAVLYSYLRGMGLKDGQINDIKNDPAALAALIAKIYDIPDSQLRFADKSELTLVALGNDEPNIKKLAGLKTAVELNQFREDSETIKQASVVAYNYDAKDEFTAIADPEAGFSSSDVALLKINVKNAPTIPVEKGRVVQNERLVIMGFPGDADNPLTDNSQTNVTVTDGVVSSIRDAAGGRGKLYQSDADTSHGNSGGPAVDDQGKVIGLVTYRYADTTNGNAPKSYIRAIVDFTELAADNNVAINSASTTQAAWEHGLEQYSKNHYSAALKDFYKVQAAYPAHRLVASYIESSRQAIADGKDVKDIPVDVLVIVLTASILALAVTVTLIIRQHAMHRVYQTSVPDAANRRSVYIAKTPAKDKHAHR